MMRYAEKYKIDLDNYDAYKDMEVTRAHALRVAGVAFSDQCLSMQEGRRHSNGPRDESEANTEDEGTMTRAQSTKAEEKDKRETKEEASSSVLGYGKASEDPLGLGPIRCIMAKSAARTKGQTRLHQRPAEAKRLSMEGSPTTSHAGPSTWSVRK